MTVDSLTKPPRTDPIACAADRDWFATHAGRRYRVRGDGGGFWVVRKRPGAVLLRVWAATPLPKGLPDTDRALRVVWFAAALPDLSPPERAALVRAAKAANA